MMSLNIQNLYLSILYYTIIVLANVQTTSTSESEVIDVITEFIGKDIRNNETLLNEVYTAIEYGWLQKEHQELELHRKEETISRKTAEFYRNDFRIKDELKTFFRALCAYKAGALITSIEEKLRPRDPEFCEHCLDWGHEKSNCTNEKPFFWGSDEEIQEKVHVRRNHWYWMLEHFRDDIDIRRISEHLEQVYYKTNFTTFHNLTVDQTPANYGKFKLIFCFALGEIHQHRNYLISWLQLHKAYLKDFKVKKVLIDKWIEIFLKALDKWVDFEEPSLLHCDDNSLAETKTMSPVESEIDKVVNLFIGKDISSNETLLQEVKNAIQHVLLKKRNLQHQVLMKNEMIRRKTKEIEGNYLDLYKAKLKTYFKALCIYKLTAELEQRFIHEYGYAKEKPPFCSKCLNWNHTTDNCNSSEITFGGNVSISKDAYNWFWMLDYPKYDDDETTDLVEHLQTAYDNGTFTNKLTPKPENFRQFQWICCEALAKVVQEENYISTSCLHEFQMRDVNIYGVSLFEHFLFLFSQIGFSHYSDILAKHYNDYK